MKNFLPPCFLFLVAGVLLAGCDSLGLPDITRHDEVPTSVKAQPMLVQRLPPTVESDERKFPRLGDVPFKPNDFSTKPVYDHYMNEMEYERMTAQQDKQTIEDEQPTLPPALPKDIGAVTAAPVSLALTPPQLSKE